MTPTYHRQGIHFMYPEGWQLTDDDADSIPRSISLQSPSGAFWSLDIHPFSVTAEEILDQVLAAMRAEYDTIDVSEVHEQIGGETAVGYDLNFYCLDFLVAAQLRCFRRGHATYMLMYQAEDREFERLAPVFAAMTFSLLQTDDSDKVDEA